MPSPLPAGGSATLSRGSPVHGTAHLGGKNLARNLATLHGQMRKIGLQGTCKVAFFNAVAEQKRTKIYRYFMSLRRKICICRGIEQQPFNQVLLGSSPNRLTNATAANEFAGRIHNRMPVFLQPKDFPGWLAAGPELPSPPSKSCFRFGPNRSASIVPPVDDPQATDADGRVFMVCAGCVSTTPPSLSADKL
jgi:hypothetical protein